MATTGASTARRRKGRYIYNPSPVYDYALPKKAGRLEEPDARLLDDIIMALDPASYLDSLGVDLFDWQRAVMRDTSTRIVIDGARQAGKSTIMSGIVCHKARFFPGSLSVILAPTLKQAKEDMGKVMAFIARDKAYPRLNKCNQEEITLSTGARILVLTATDDAARGFSNPDIILFDEASRIPDSVFNAVRPMITNNRRARIYEISTPKGKKGFFYRHFHTQSWSRYRVRAPYYPVETPQGLTLLDYKWDLSYDKPGVHFFFSPRHYDRDEQLEALEQMQKRQYDQEYGTDFVDAEDQVFAMELIRAAFDADVQMPKAEQTLETDYMSPEIARLMSELSRMDIDDGGGKAI